MHCGPGAISAPTTWTPDNVYVLTGHLFVTDGAVLTIEAGTVVRAQPCNALVVTRGSGIRVLGTAAAPVVFTDMADDHYVGPNPQPGTAPYATPNNGISGQWAGLIVLGNAVISGEGEAILPGFAGHGDRGRFGGADDEDISGEIQYLSVRYAGCAPGGGVGHGVTLAGVGRGTVMDHVEVFQSAGGAFGFLGGAVNASALAAWSCAGDAFACSQGYRGKGQFWLGVHGPLEEAGLVSRKGLELNGGLATGIPVTVPRIANVTLVGLGAAASVSNNVLHFRDMAGGRLHSSLFLDFGGAAALVQGAPGGALDSADACNVDYEALRSLDPYLYPDLLDGKMLEVRHSTFWKIGPSDTGLAAPTDGTAWGVDGGDYYAYPLFADATLHNHGLRGSPGMGEIDPLPVTQLSRLAAPVSIGGAHYYPLSVLNPLPATGFYGNDFLTDGQVPPADGFFKPVWFVGAFDGTHNWAAPWTLAWRLGLLTGGTAGDTLGTAVDIKAQGLDGGVAIAAGEPLTVTLDVTAGSAAGLGADWWCLAYEAAADAWWYYVSDYNGASWQPWTGAVSYGAPLHDVTAHPAVNAKMLPAGTYVFYFGVDLVTDGRIDADSLLFDSVDVTVTP
jgi:hypothetical protein